MAITSTIAGVLEAMVLVVVVQLALLITSNEDHIDRSLGPFDLSLTAPWLFAIAFSASLLRLALMIYSSWVTAKIADDVLSNLRREAYRAFLAASWDLQSHEREGRLQDLMSTHGRRMSKATLLIANGLNASVVAATLLIAAFLVNAMRRRC